MREILFRAKRKNLSNLPKEEWWVEGYYCYFMNEHCIIPKNLDTDATLFGEQKVFVIIDPETLCQYTGMNDKNGNRIWENDIVKCNKRKDGFEFYKVLWRKYYADFGVEPLEFGIQYPIGLGENEQDIKGCNYEVIGNIFDNPELLKGEGVCTDL